MGDERKKKTISVHTMWVLWLSELMLATDVRTKVSLGHSFNV